MIMKDIDTGAALLTKLTPSRPATLENKQMQQLRHKKRIVQKTPRSHPLGVRVMAPVAATSTPTR